MHADRANILDSSNYDSLVDELANSLLCISLQMDHCIIIYGTLLNCDSKKKSEPVYCQNNERQ